MDGARLQDLISRGMGVAARVAGVDCEAYRPSGTCDPLAPERRFLALRAAFNAEDPSFRHSNAYGRPVWYGVFDVAYTQPGDYLVECAGGRRIWFVAMQPPLLPVVCVLANRVVNFVRPAAPALAGANSYGGVIRGALVPLLTNWPASVLAGGIGERQETELPGDTRPGGFSVLLPASATANVVLRVDDLMTDDLDRNFVVSSAELSELGWRLAVRQVMA